LIAFSGITQAAAPGVAPSVMPAYAAASHDTGASAAIGLSIGMPMLLIGLACVAHLLWLIRPAPGQLGSELKRLIQRISSAASALRHRGRRLTIRSGPAGRLLPP
jgi:hypothetical protein